MRSIRLAALLTAVLFFLPMPAARAEQGLSAIGSVDVYSIADETRIRKTDSTVFSLSELGEGEYASFCFRLTNDTSGPVDIQSSYARIDGGERLGWSTYTLQPGGSAALHIFQFNMQKVSPGIHYVELYVNDERTAGQYFTLIRDWDAEIGLPGRAAVNDFRPVGRSPYISVHPDLSAAEGFTEYAVDFRADHQPTGTYLCCCNWDMDTGSLRERYPSVARDYEGVAGYAGFQVRGDGVKLAIMSVWDTYCRDREGRTVTICPTVVYASDALVSQAFDGEGSGTQCLVAYDWKEGHPYRMLLQQSRSETTGNTLMAMWVCDLETMRWTKLIEYDLGYGDTWMDRAVAFLEDFQVQTAGEVRSMELSSFRVRDRKSGSWISADRAVFLNNYAYAGSYTFGSDEGCFYVATTGLPGQWRAPSEGAYFTVSRAETGVPY
ncbi:MAG: DUF3472 domain-containing protein [Clostridia bacterium]|nr:DUF3472 domain-containing protein [Clostridia bacterium]